MALITLGANAITALPSGIGGKVLQVVQAVLKQILLLLLVFHLGILLMLLVYRFL
jgi:hypothetical protein